MYRSGIRVVISCLLSLTDQCPLPSSPHLSSPGGRLLSWGWNEHGMCGDGSETDVSEPQPIPALRPLVIGCGAGHSMALCAVRTGEEESTEDMEIEQATLYLFELTYQDCTWVRSLTAGAADLKLNVYCFISMAEDTRLTVGRESNMIGYES
ncbi:unnamed protein product [Oncorhynchus mykiss]|uniref:Uncharacterized protein n=1 Tax=Oncorhynchus mykiss TaxID=8022 RepID=A0A060YW20_ONCMY|nr:unnamed protein product [Oncorhynchus mykiss]